MTKQNIGYKKLAILAIAMVISFKEINCTNCDYDDFEEVVNDKFSVEPLSHLLAIVETKLSNGVSNEISIEEELKEDDKLNQMKHELVDKCNVLEHTYNDMIIRMSECPEATGFNKPFGTDAKLTILSACYRWVKLEEKQYL